MAEAVDVDFGFAADAVGESLFVAQGEAAEAALVVAAETGGEGVD